MADTPRYVPKKALSTSAPTGLWDVLTRLVGAGPNSGPYYEMDTPQYPNVLAKADRIRAPARVLITSKKKKK